MDESKRRSALRGAQARLREKRKALGMVRIDIWAHPDDVAEVRQLAKDFWVARLASTEATSVCHPVVED